MSEPSPPPGPSARGERSVSVGVNPGIANTGDNPTFHVAQVGAGTIPQPGTVTPVGRVWNVPRRPSRVFVGRDQALERLDAVLAAGSGVVGQSVAGLGGVGKTELVLHHVYRRRERWGVVWWIVADSLTGLTTGLAGLARRLAPATSVLDIETCAEWALSWLGSHEGWLLVLDNLDEPDLIGRVLAVADSGQVVVTTRRRIDWPSRGLTLVPLDVLDVADGADLLVRRTEAVGRDEYAAAAQVAEAVGGLPLALEQAAAYLTATATSIADYARLLADQPAVMLAETAPADASRRAVARTWAITLEAIQATDPAAVELLGVLAWLAPDNIPRALADDLFDGDRLAATRALTLLDSYSMITLTQATIDIHRLVQAVLRPTPTAGQVSDPPATATKAVTLLTNAIPDGDPQTDTATWPAWATLAPHITALADHLPTSHHEPLGRLLNQTGLYLSTQGLYHQAHHLKTIALAIAEAAFGPDHPTVAICLGNLANSYSELGRPAEAVPLKQRALAITEATLGPDHPDVAICLGNLAANYRALGRPAEALPLEQRALAITEATFGPDHPRVAIRLGNLAANYSDLGRPADAAPLSQRALAITEAALGPDHPRVAICLGNLAANYRELGRPADAAPLSQRALAITEAALGPDHPTVAIRLGHLAANYSDLGRPDEAVPLEQRALAITEATFGPDHPRVAICLGNLAANYSDLGRPADAAPLCQRALAITEATFGPDHPRMANRLGNLAASYRALGRSDEAVTLEQRALAIIRQSSE